MSERYLLTITERIKPHVKDPEIPSVSSGLENQGFKGVINLEKGKVYILSVKSDRIDELSGELIDALKGNNIAYDYGCSIIPHEE